MKTIVYPLVGVAAVLFAGLSVAGEPAGKAEERRVGRILVLLNERVLHGEVERVGERYHVRREIGSTWVPVDQALHLCDDLAEAYTFVRRRANPSDPDERLRLAHWCRLNGLEAEALGEARAALDLRPDHRPTQLLVRLLEERARSPRPAAPVPEPADEESALPPVDVDADSLSAFAARVQPILMNTCLRCHTSGQGGDFHLQRVASPGLLNRRSTQHNLAAVMRQVDYRRPEASPLLTKAVSDHAQTGRAPLGGRDEQAYRALLGWVRETLKNNPHLARQAGAVGLAPEPPAPPPPAVRPAAPGRSEWGEARGAPEVTDPVVVRPLEPAVGAAPAAKAPPRDLPLWAQAFQAGQVPPGGDVRPASAVSPGPADDPYDPEAFNRQGSSEPAVPAAAPTRPPQRPGAPPQGLPAAVTPPHYLQTPGVPPQAAPGGPPVPPLNIQPYSPGGPWQVGVVRPRPKSSPPGTASPSHGRNP